MCSSMARNILKAGEHFSPVPVKSNDFFIAVDKKNDDGKKYSVRDSNLSRSSVKVNFDKDTGDFRSLVITYTSNF